MTDPIWTRRSTQMVEVSTAQPDADPVWQDISRYVLMVGSGQPVSISRGRQTELAQADPSRLSLALNNSDDRFTPDNPTSPYVAWWKQGRRIRWREKVGPWVFDLYDGYLQLPEVVIQLPGVDQVLNVAAVDRLGRMDQPGTEFPSTVAAHILASSRNDVLRGYWSLLDTIGRPAPLVGSDYLDIKLLGTSLSPAEQLVSVDYGGGATLPGDDLPGLLLTYGLNAGVPASVPEVSLAVPEVGTPDRRIYLTAGQVMTVVGWASPNAVYSGIGGMVVDVETSSGLGYAANLVDVSPAIDASGYHWHLVYNNGSFWNVDSDNGTAAGTDRWTSIAARWGFSPNVIELWVDDKQYTGTFTETITTMRTIGFDFGVDGSLAHAQLYIGDPADFTFTDYLAQRQVALTGLERQTAGDRVNSLLDYAGVGPSQRDVDLGVAVMARASLSGKTPLSALREPEATERGLLFTDGRGQILFRDRVRRYNL